MYPPWWRSVTDSKNIIGRLAPTLDFFELVELSEEEVEQIYATLGMAAAGQSLQEDDRRLS